MPIIGKGQSFCLVHNGEKTVLATFNNGTVSIVNDGLRAQLSLSGVQIPLNMRDRYGGREVVLMSDTDFSKAFREVFVPKQVRESSYRDDSHGIDIHYEVI